MSRIYPIYKYPGLFISFDGSFYNKFHQIFPVKFKNKYCIEYQGQHIDAVTVAAEFYYGYFNGIAELQDLTIVDLSNKNIKYRIETFMKINDSTLLINGTSFKRIRNFDNYFISNYGVIYSTYHQKILCRSFNHRNYPTVALINNQGKRSPKKVHRLVYDTFIEPLNPELVIDHIDSNKQNAYYANLDQVTQRINLDRAYTNGQNPIKRWADNDIHTICQYIEQNLSINEILKLMHLDDSCYRHLSVLIYDIRTNRRYSEISKYYNIKNYVTAINRKSTKLTIDNVREIRRLLNLKIPISDIAKRYQCTTSTITKIRDHITWNSVS